MSASLVFAFPLWFSTALATRSQEFRARSASISPLSLDLPSKRYRGPVITALTKPPAVILSKSNKDSDGVVLPSQAPRTVQNHIRRTSPSRIPRPIPFPDTVTAASVAVRRCSRNYPRNAILARSRGQRRGLTGWNMFSCI